MAIYQPESFYETTITAAITASQNTITVTTAPNILSGYLVIEANTSNREIIKYTGVTGTTLTGVVRGLASYGSDDSAGTGKAHAAGVDIANKDVHFYYAQYYDYLVGTSATGANTMRIGDGNTISASNRLWYVHTSSLSAWWGLSANGKFVISEDGSTSYVVSAGGSGVSEGAGIDITAGVVTFNYLSAGGFRLSGDKIALNVSQGVSTTSAGELYVDPTHDFTWTGSHTFKGAVSLSSVNAASATFASLPTAAGLTPTSGSELTTKSYVDDSVKPYAFGVHTTTSAHTASFAHGLGTTPTKLKITAMCHKGTYDNPTSIGLYDGTNYACNYTADAGTGVTTSYIAFINPASDQFRASASMDATRVSVTWFDDGSPSVTIGWLWEAFKN